MAREACILERGLMMIEWFIAHAEITGSLVNIFGILLAAATIIIQLRYQHKNTLDAQRVNSEQALKLRIYENLSQRIKALQDSLSDAIVYVLRIPFDIQGYQHGIAAGNNASLPKQRVPKFIELNSIAGNQLAELLIEIESWAIAIPNIYVFRVALNAANYDTQQAFHPLFSALLKILPYDPPEGESGKPSIPIRPPTPEQFANFERLVDSYTKAMHTVDDYASDLIVEGQNILLKGLFQCTIPLRQPIDKRNQVISSKNAEALIRYFENETPWGKNNREIQESVLSQIGQQKELMNNKGQ